MEPVVTVTGEGRTAARLRRLAGDLEGIDFAPAANEVAGVLRSRTPIDTGELVAGHHVVVSERSATIRNPVNHLRPALARDNFVARTIQSERRSVRDRIRDQVRYLLRNWRRQ